MDSAGNRQQRPAFPGSASQVSSASQSSSSLSTLASPSVFSSVSGTASQQPFSGVPMPPSSPAPQANYFGSLQPETQQVQRAGAAAAPQISRTASLEYQPNREGAGRTAQETVTYLNEYSLVAEAAKRAQMAVLMRDMEGVELS
ncbi:hypothetical protein BFW01_g1009 [Lasiodiplodia theobromae]|uniref:Uncharacterized protein n=2 Tax=Lasiodiplodia TaxID=66739 RepID=A0A5N5D922_9PEZI|nr:Thiol methyltransferase protein [Lasiodiplodia theobromae]KAB2573802.1 hypothetical protein DBV05_g7524 [Lasiodiplodia theobromae]KAF4546312.1 Thiol methyltransferase protein [Lasiodiplodia theobromae]KAF9630447.1 hypothetical protein BFW01_g1009 [Lasiodiplodia theobromae]KAK0653522.1 hypothetical protein DIS24_g5977 [Lasiodiplodia hormozganensis]